MKSRGGQQRQPAQNRLGGPEPPQSLCAAAAGMAANAAEAWRLQRDHFWTEDMSEVGLAGDRAMNRCSSASVIRQQI
ncbi:MAG: hypothetical protein R2911_09575 [Caldilineaceae bacterium]